MCKSVSFPAVDNLAVMLCLSHSNWLHGMKCWLLFQIQASSQLRGIGTTVGHPTARVQNSGIQTVTSSAASQGSHVASSQQIPLKHGVCKLTII